MLFSCKITNTVLNFLEEQGEDLQPLLEISRLPEEFLRDPSYWMDAGEMEQFLEMAQKVSRESGGLLPKVGHASPKLRSWGVLDSVLRMMPRPQEIFNQPQRFLSYFVSPEPPVENIRASFEGIEFDLPVSSEMYPLVTSYLKSSFESLPLYVGQPQAHCTWNDLHLTLDWCVEQDSMFSEDPGHQISPELLRSIVSSLEVHQRELEAKNRELQAKNQTLQRVHQEQQISSAQVEHRIKDFGSRPIHSLDFIEESSLKTLQSNFSKLSDYMIRAQQLVTLLVGADRLKPGIKEAMKRTDWEKIKDQFPATVRESTELINQSIKKNQEQKNV